MMHDLFPRIVVLQPQTSAVADVADFATVIAMVVAVAAVVVSLFVYYHDKRPDIVAYIDANPERMSVYFVVENIGKGVAYDIEVSGFDFEMAEQGVFREMAEKSFIAKGVPMLTPGKSRSTIISTPKYVRDHLADSKSEVTVICKRKSFGGIMKEQEGVFVLDYYSFSNILRVDSDMHIIARGVEKIAGID